MLSHLVKAHRLLLTRLRFRLSSAAATRDHEELRDLVSVLAWCRDLDWAGPVVVEVTQGKCQLLQFDLGKIRIILWNVEVSGQNATLSRVCWCHEEIKHATRVVLTFILNQSLIDDAARRRVTQTTFLILDKEPLCDALVDYNNSNLWLRSCLVVQLVDRIFKLRDLCRKYLVAHSITHTITIDDEVRWELILVVRCKHLNSFFQSFLHVLLNNLLALLLGDVLRVVLAHLFVG